MVIAWHVFGAVQVTIVGIGGGRRLRNARAEETGVPVGTQTDGTA